MARASEVHTVSPRCRDLLHGDPAVCVRHYVEMAVDFVLFSGSEVLPFLREYLLPRSVGGRLVEPVASGESLLPDFAPAEPVEVFDPQVFVRAHDRWRLYLHTTDVWPRQSDEPGLQPWCFDHLAVDSVEGLVCSCPLGLLFVAGFAPRCVDVLPLGVRVLVQFLVDPREPLDWSPRFVTVFAGPACVFGASAFLQPLAAPAFAPLVALILF